MEKFILLTIVILILTGCSIKIVDYEENGYLQDSDNYLNVIDRDTCIEYIIFSDYHEGGITVRFNLDGTPMINKKCLLEKKLES